MDNSKAARAIREGRVQSVYVVTGDSEFLRREFILFLKQELGDAGLGDIDRSDIEVESPDDVLFALDQASVPTFLGGRRLVTVSGGTAFGGGPASDTVTERICSYLATPSSDSVVVFDVPVLDKRRKTSKAAVKQGVVVECNAPRGNALPGYVKRRARLQGAQIADDAVTALIGATGGDPGLLASEVSKLASAVGPDGQITRELVRELTGVNLGDTAFTLVDAVLSGDAARAIEIVTGLMLRSEQPIQLMALLHSQVRTLLWVTVLNNAGTDRQAISSRVSAHPYVISNCLRRASTVNVDQLLDAITAFHETDVAVKTGRRDARLALELLIMRLTVNRPTA